jgi:phosphoglycolate phosphatase-like HAD superfamily hydrolase
MIAKIFAVGSVAAMFLAGCCDKRASCEDCAKSDVKSAAVSAATAAVPAESRQASTLAEQSKQAVLPEKPQESLSLWNDHAPAKDSLEAFVRATTDSTSPDFIPAERRIAVFDWDGTLFLETAPTYFDWMLFEHRVLDDSTYKPSKKQLKAAREGREKKIFPGLSAERERMVAEAYKGMTLSEFEAYVRAFMQEPQPGFTGLKRGEAYYKPMVEVIKYLTANGFTVYVSSGTERYTMRPVVVDGLGLPPKQIIGSDVVVVTSNQKGADGLAYTFQNGDNLVLAGQSIIKNLQTNKVTTLASEIGYQPVLAFGNSGTDASLLNYAISNNKYRSMGFMLLCDDLEREYGNEAKAEKMRTASEKNGWIPVSMKNDWKTIYGDGVQKAK